MLPILNIFNDFKFSSLKQSYYIYILLLLVFPVFLGACKEEKSAVKQITEATQTTSEAKASPGTAKVPVYKFDEFEPLLNKDDGKIYVVNFWATWCKPCIKELPYFETIAAKYADQNVEVLLVSIDFPKLLEKQVIPFIEKNQIKSPVVLLDDTGANEWIPKVDESWSGAIPATVIYKGDERKFYEQSFTLEELEQELNTFL